MAAANNEFFEALSMLEHERGITAEYLIEKIKAAIVIAVKKNYEVEDDNVLVEIDPDSGKFNVALVQNVVADEDWYDEHAEIGITEAQKIRKSYEVGDRVVTPLKTKDFGRIAAQTAKHVIRQGIREAERSQQLSEIQSRAHDIIQATVTRVDNEKGIVALDLGKGGEAILPRNEQVPGETYTEGQTLQVYVVDVVSGERGARVMISRTHPGLVKRLFELEVPEIYDGTVEVKAISREAGARTKMAVWSKDANVNPVSACIGPHGDRVAAVVEKLGGEKIDIVKWSEDVSEFISAALSPAKVLKVELLPGETRSCRVTVPDQQLIQPPLIPAPQQPEQLQVVHGFPPLCSLYLTIHPLEGISHEKLFFLINGERTPVCVLSPFAISLFRARDRVFQFSPPLRQQSVRPCPAQDYSRFPIPALYSAHSRRGAAYPSV